ncbi:MAG: hypothetical protein ACOX5G_11345 [Kiritimatiellia bacterium]
MKKLMIASAAVVACAMLARSAEVVSGNIVGYHTVDLASSAAGTYNMIGINWNKVGGTALPINEIWADPAGAGLFGSADFRTADQILVWTGNGYTVYYLYDTGAGDPEWDNKWYEVGNDDYPTTHTIGPRHRRVAPQPRLREPDRHPPGRGPGGPRRPGHRQRLQHARQRLPGGHRPQRPRLGRAGRLR